MLFLYENIAPITVAFAASAVTWIFGGARGDLVVRVVPWLLAMMFEVLFCFPQRYQGESIYAARARVWRSLGRSGVTWTAVGFVCLLLIPFVNTGLCPGCDAALIAQGANPAPPVRMLPFCVNKGEHLTTVLWFVFALSSVLLMEHAVLRDGKRLALSIIVWNGVALSLLGFVQGMTNAPGPFWIPLSDTQPSRSLGVFFSVFGYPNMAGAYFTLLFGVAIALWRDRCARIRHEESKMDASERMAISSRRFDRIVARHYYLIPAVLFFFSALYTLSRAAILLVTTTASIYYFHTLALHVRRYGRSRRLFIIVWSVVVFLLFCFFASIFMPKDVRREVDTLDSYSMLDRLTGKGQYHSKVATSIWLDHPLFGCGGWGYVHFCLPKMARLDIPTNQVQRVGGANVHNDYLQFLVEHGAVGLGCLAAVVFLLLAPIFRSAWLMLKAYRFKKDKKKLPHPIQIFILPAPVFIILAACAATLIHALGDCPFRALSVLNLLFVLFSSLSCFMPHSREYADVAR